MEWDGYARSGNNLTYQVTVDEVPGVCNADLDNQATLHMDPNGDGLNTIDELSDDANRNDGIDSDDDNGSDNAGLDDDDPTRIHVDCSTISIVKNVISDDGRTVSISDFGIEVGSETVVFDTGTPPADTVTYTSNTLVVPVGTYTLTELDVPNYTEGAWSCTAGTGLINTFNAGSITLATGDVSVCSIDNDDDPMQADLSILKTDGISTYTPGEPFSYTITIDNGGPDGADGAVFADSLPPWAIGATWTCFASAGAICLNASGMGSINEIIPALPDGGQVVYVVNGNYSTDMTDY